MAKFSFDEIFRENPDGSLTPIRRIRVGGVIFSQGVSFRRGVAFGGVDFHEFKGHEIEAEEDKDVLVIKSIY